MGGEAPQQDYCGHLHAILRPWVQQLHQRRDGTGCNDGECILRVASKDRQRCRCLTLLRATLKQLHQRAGAGNSDGGCVLNIDSEEAQSRCRTSLDQRWWRIAGIQKLHQERDNCTRCRNARC